MVNSNKNKSRQFNTFEDIRNEYSYIRQLNLIKYEENKEKIHSAHPILGKLDLDIVNEYINLAKSINNDTEQGSIEKKLADLTLERDKYIKEHNIDSSYLEVPCNCDKCKDTGFIDGRKCSCFIQKEIELFDNISHFKQYIQTDNFDNLDESYYNQDIQLSGNIKTYKKYMELAVNHMKDGVKNMDERPYNAIFIGAVGTGKTFLARCIGTEALKQDKSVLYINVNEYINSLKPDYNGVPLEPYAVACDLFIIDDLGTEYCTEFAVSKLNYIIDKRLNDNKSTIITTNLVPKELEERYFDAMLSRITHIYTKYMLNGEDLRRVKNAEQ